MIPCLENKVERIGMAWQSTVVSALIDRRTNASCIPHAIREVKPGAKVGRNTRQANILAVGLRACCVECRQFIHGMAVLAFHVLNVTTKHVTARFAGSRHRFVDVVPAELKQLGSPAADRTSLDCSRPQSSLTSGGQFRVCL
jgi:hypothetical protein